MKRRPLAEIFETAKRIQTLLISEQVRFCFIGGVAVQRWGKVRITNDVDLTLFAGYGKEGHFIDLLTRHFKPRRADYVDFATQYRIVLLQDTNSVGIDVSLAALPYESELLERATSFEFAEGYNLITCSAEDLIILKAYANRDQDWFDVRNILIRFASTLQRELIFDIITQLADLKGDRLIVNKLEKMFEEILHRA